MSLYDRSLSEYEQLSAHNSGDQNLEPAEITKLGFGLLSLALVKMEIIFLVQLSFEARSARIGKPRPVGPGSSGALLPGEPGLRAPSKCGSAPKSSSIFTSCRR